ncbi:MAG: hypothetical protein ACJ8AG_04910 [Ktedonobacteraceae bacterium]
MTKRTFCQPIYGGLREARLIPADGLPLSRVPAVAGAKKPVPQELGMSGSACPVTRYGTTPLPPGAHHT